MKHTLAQQNPHQWYHRRLSVWKKGCRTHKEHAPPPQKKPSVVKKFLLPSGSAPRREANSQPISQLDPKPSPCQQWATNRQWVAPPFFRSAVKMLVCANSNIFTPIFFWGGGTPPIGQQSVKQKHTLWVLCQWHTRVQSVGRPIDISIGNGRMVMQAGANFLVGGS